MIITIEGMDSSGKNWLGKKIADHFDLQFFDTDYKKERVKTDNFRNYVFGMLHTENQVYNSLDNFVKPRYHLSQDVYSRQFDDWNISYSIDNLIECCEDRHLTILLVPTYGVHCKISEMKHEDPFTLTEFDYYDRAFKKAYTVTPGFRKTLLNNGTLEELWSRAEKVVKTFGLELSKT